MKVCPKCSTENSDYDWICQKCGAALGKSTPSKADPMDVLTGKASFTPSAKAETDQPSESTQRAGAAQAAWERAKAVLKDAVPPQAGGGAQRSRNLTNRLFIDPSEELRASIGSNYVQNFLSGGHVGRSVGALSQKRFYYKGKNYNAKSKLLWSTEEEGIVSVEDISYTGFSYTSAIGLLIIGAVLALVGFICLVVSDNAGARIAGGVLMLIGALAFVRYYLSRDTLFIVSFPGGSFGFDTKWYSIADMQDFQRQLHLIKDQLKEGQEE